MTHALFRALGPLPGCQNYLKKGFEFSIFSLRILTNLITNQTGDGHGQSSAVSTGSAFLLARKAGVFRMQLWIFFLPLFMSPLLVGVALLMVPRTITSHN